MFVYFDGIGNGRSNKQCVLCYLIEHFVFKITIVISYKI